MITAKSDRFNRKAEAGVFQVLVPIVAVAIFAVLLALGLDAGIVKKASAMLSNHTENICKAVVSRPTIQRQAAETFSAQINSFISSNPSRITITSANLIIPTMPQEGDFALQTDPPNPLEQPSQPVVFSPTRFSALISAAKACQLNCTSQSGCSDCIFYGNVSDPYLKKNYPIDLWDNLIDAGSIVGCEIHATVHAISGDKPIEAKSVWVRNIRGVFETYDPSTPQDIKRTAPGLSIAIAPQLTTNAGDMRFRFESTYEDRPSFDPLFRFFAHDAPAFSGTSEKLDYGLPLDHGTGGGTATTVTFPTPMPISAIYHSAPYPLPVTTPTPGPQASAPFLRAVQTIAPKGAQDPYDELPGCDPSDLTQIPGKDCLWLSDREEMLAACMNPVILLRNILLSTVTELAARHGQLREMTQILMVGTENRDLVDNANLNSLPKIPNNPVEIVGLGQDLVQLDPAVDPSKKRYTIPFVSFDSGDTGRGPSPDPTPSSGKLISNKGGMINPFTLPSTAGAALKAHHALIASQLRYCYHLFEGTNPGNGLDRYRVPALWNANFQPPVYDFNAMLRPSQFHYFERWDQDCPWGSAGGCYMNSTNRRISAPELVSALGSIQACPYEQGGLPSAHFGADGICYKPPPGSADEPPLDLHADILGLLYHLAKQAAPGQPDAPFHSFPALVSPGIFPIDNPSSTNIPPNPWFPYARSPNKIYVESVNERTPILLVLHQRLVPAEVDIIKSLTDKKSGAFKDRPITVVYLPANSVDADPKSIDNLRKAFSIDVTVDSTDPTSKTDNALFIFSPDLEHTTNESRAFRDYWSHLLDVSSDDNMEVSARNIFYDRLLTMELKL